MLAIQPAAIFSKACTGLFFHSLGNNADGVLERNTEEVDPVHFSGTVGIDQNIFLRHAVLGRRERIEHLQWIATADQTWNHAGNILVVDGFGPVSLAHMMSVLKRSGARWLT